MKKAFKITLWNSRQNQYQTIIVVARHAPIAIAGAIEDAAFCLKAESPILKKRPIKQLRGYFTINALEPLGNAVIV